MSALAKKRYAVIAKKLKSSGLKLTPQRLAIIRILVESMEHPSVDAICARLHKSFPGISQATVYRNVMLIKSLGEAYEIALAGKSSRYDARKPFSHPHIVCLECDRIIDPELDSLRDMTREITDESGFEVLTYRLDFFGLCPACRQKNKNKFSVQKRRKI